MAWPTYLLLSRGKKSTLIEAKLPFIDTDSNAEFRANFMLECLFDVYGIFTHILIEICVTTFNDIVLGSKKLLEHRLQKLQAKHIRKTFKNTKIFTEFKIIVDHILDYDK